MSFDCLLASLMYTSLQKTTTQEPLSPSFIIMFLSCPDSFNACGSSLDMLDGADRKSFKISFSSWLKKTSNPEWTGRGFQLDLGRNAVLSEDFLRSGLFIDFWIGAKSNSFWKTWISFSESTLKLKLKTVYERWRRSSSVTVTLVDKTLDFTMGLPISFCVPSSTFCKLFKTERSSSSKFLTALSWFFMFYRGSSAFGGVLVLLEVEIQDKFITINFILYDKVHSSARVVSNCFLFC